MESNKKTGSSLEEARFVEAVEPKVRPRAYQL